MFTSHRFRSADQCTLAAFALLVLISTAAAAQPFGAWMNPTAGDYIRVPHSTALNPTGALTVEAWVNVNSSSCVSIGGKDWTEAWWLGVCNGTIRSYMRGSSSLRDGGTVPPGEWTHIAIVFDGLKRRHYVNGEQTGVWNEPSPLTTSTAEMQIGHDVSWSVPPGSVDEFRVWNVARTKGQLRNWINRRIAAPQPGLIGVWGLDGGPNAAVGPHDGSFVGSPGFLTLPVVAGCGLISVGPNSICLSDRFLVSIDWRIPDGTTGKGTAAPCGTADTGIFWFFNPDNWEVMVKALDGCGFPSPRHWIFSASTTNVYYRMQVTDVVAGAQKIYFNYPGPPAPAVTDTSAFATCP